MKKILLKLIRGAVILAVFVPLAGGYVYFFPLEFAKTTLLKIIVEAAVVLYLILLVIDSNWLPWKKIRFGALEIALPGYFTAVIAAAVFAQNPYLAFWGEPERGGGVFSLIHYGLLFFLALIFFDDEKKRRKLWNCAIAVSLFIAAIAVEQKFNFFGIPFLNYYERSASTIGNANFLAAYLLLLIFPTFAFALRSEKKREAAFYFSAAIIQGTAIISSASRGAFFGLIAGVLLFLFLYPTKAELGFAKRHIPKLTAVFLILALAGFFYFAKTNESGNFSAPEDNIIRRLTTISLSEHTTQTRLLAWQISWNAFKEKPLLGWGPENFSIGFDKHFNPELEKWGKTETWFDRAHNFIFDIGVTSGIVGLVAYLAIFAATFYKLSLKKRRLLSDPQSTIYNLKSKIIVLVGLQSAFAGYLIQNLFNFDTVSTYIISFLMLAYTSYVVNSPDDSREPASLISNFQFSISKQIPNSKILIAALKMIIAVIIILLFSKLIFFASLRPFWTNSEVNRLVSLIQINYPRNAERVFGQFSKLAETQTPYDHYFYLLKQSPWEFAYAKTLRDRDPKKSAEMVRETIEKVKKYGRLRPHYARNYTFLADLYDFLIQQGHSEFQKDKDEALRKAKELSPFRY
ncbi:MAG: hypothetical protein UX55_C0024G0005, partial [Candidatus Azambacteria bacterium GW2011_GWE2_46_45]|uniref:O-antigen ligase-related domain-containing protein n=4 Tax=Candidatus Azamiibacteriota TaxID=1752741 RepID=A0A0G1Q668_9BACT